MFSKGNLREEMTTDDADLTGIFRSRRTNGRRLKGSQMAEIAETTNECEQSYTCIDFVERGGGRQ